MKYKSMSETWLTLSKLNWKIIRPVGLTDENINSREQILKLIEISNNYGFKSVNIELTYGLPLQTVNSFQGNVELAVSMDISRLTITKYSHFPKYFPSQRKLDKYPLPSEVERLLIFYNSKEQLKNYDFKLIELDLFVTEYDPLFGAEKENKLVRNFMGYDDGSFI